MDNELLSKMVSARKVILDTSYKKMDEELKKKAENENNRIKIRKVGGTYGILASNIYEHNFHPVSIYDRKDDDAQAKFMIEAEIHDLLKISFYYFEELKQIIINQSAKDVLNYNKEIIDEINNLEKLNEEYEKCDEETLKTICDVYRNYIEKTEEYIYACTMQNCYEDIKNRLTAIVNLSASCNLAKNIDKNPAMTMVNGLNMVIRALCTYSKVNSLPKSDDVFNINFALKKAIAHFERDDPNFYNSVGNEELNEKIAKNEVNSSRYEGTWKNKYLLAVAEEEIKKIGQQSPYSKFSYETIEQIDDNYYNECKNIFIDYSLYHSNRGDIIVNYLKYHLDFYALLLFPFHFENISLYENVIVDHLNNSNFERIKEIFTKYNALEILTQDEKTIFIVAGEKQPKDFLDKIYKKFKESFIGDSCPLNKKYDIKTAENIIKIIFINSNQTKQDSKLSPKQMLITLREVFHKSFREFIQFFFLYCVGLIEFYAFRQEVNTIEDECHKEINAVKESPASEHIDRAIGSIWTKAMINEEDYPDIEKRVKEEFARMKKARKNIIY